MRKFRIFIMLLLVCSCGACSVLTRNTEYTIQEVKDIFFENHQLFSDVGEILAMNEDFWKKTHSDRGRYLFQSLSSKNEDYFTSEEWDKMSRLFVMIEADVWLIPVKVDEPDRMGAYIRFDFSVADEERDFATYSLIFLSNYGGAFEDVDTKTKLEKSTTRENGTVNKLDDRWYELIWQLHLRFSNRAGE